MKIIGITGNKGSGKSTVAKILCELGWYELSFAQPLKEGLQKIFNLTDEQIYGNEKEIIDSYWNVTPRELLQVIGTDLLREQLPLLLPQIKDSTLWIQCLDKKLQELKYHNKGTYKGIVISDVRFIDEIQYIRHQNGHIWHVINDDYNLNELSQHSSEKLSQNITDIKPNHIIYNNSTFDDLKYKVTDLNVQI
jgi:dephospho-CoA kinase